MLQLYINFKSRQVYKRRRTRLFFIFIMSHEIKAQEDGIWYNNEEERCANIKQSIITICSHKIQTYMEMLRKSDRRNSL